MVVRLATCIVMNLLVYMLVHNQQVLKILSANNNNDILHDI